MDRRKGQGPIAYTTRLAGTLALGAALLAGTGCDTDDVLFISASNFVAGLNAPFVHRDNGTTAACPAPDRNHAGVFYPGSLAAPYGFAPDTVCVTAGLSHDTAQHGTVALHEAGHLYMYRLGQIGAWIDYRNEHLADCFAILNGGGLAKDWAHGIAYGCSSSEQSFMQGFLAAYPADGTGWW